MTSGFGQSLLLDSTLAKLNELCQAPCGCRFTFTGLDAGTWAPCALHGAAPDLLEALEWTTTLLWTLFQQRDNGNGTMTEEEAVIYDNAMAALARARGKQPHGS